MNESRWRDRMAMHGESLHRRGLVPGASGNLSVLLDDDTLLVTPTNSCLGRLDPAQISKVSADGRHLSGDPPSKEAFLHLAMYRARPADRAVVHLHSTCSVALACRADVDPGNVLPAITAYRVMRVGKLPLVPYFPPGDRNLADAVGRFASRHHAVLLANHGPVVSGRELDPAVYAIEELEETAKLYFLLEDKPTRLLTRDQIAHLEEVFGS